MKKIILVEDDAVVGKLYRFHLEKAGYDVKVETDGEAGWNAIRTNLPDAVLLDMMMPKISGIAVLRQLRAEPKLATVPVLVFSNAYVPAMIDEAKKAGANHVFDKATVTPQMILESLKEAFSNHTEKERGA